MDPMTLMTILMGASGGVGNLLGGAANAFGSWRASEAQKEAAQQAMNLQRDIWGQQQQQQAPWLQAGQSTLADLLSQMRAGGFDRRVDPNSLANDPGYQFRLAEGQKALERSAAARGGLSSGGTLRSLARYSQGVAADEYQNAWARNQAEGSGRFNRLAHIAGMGQNAANNLGSMGGQYANNMSNLLGAYGNADAAGWMGTTNAFADTMGKNSGIAMGMAGQMGGMLPTQAPRMQMPTQGASTGYASNYQPPNGFGLNYGGR